jgi:hypothetical protein
MKEYLECLTTTHGGTNINNLVHDCMNVSKKNNINKSGITPPKL